jgi:hypothetical protein
MGGREVEKEGEGRGSVGWACEWTLSSGANGHCDTLPAHTRLWQVYFSARC